MGRTMRYPAALPPQGTIGCIAPSYGCNIEPYRSAFDHAQKVWKKMGYQVRLGPNCYEGSGLGISSTPQRCAAEVHSFFEDPSCDVILSCGGGELMCEVVSQVDFARLAAAAPKWYMGFSDNTNLTFLLPTLCDMAAIYGPCAPAFGMREWHPALRDAWELLCGGRTEVRGYPLWEKESRKDAGHPLEPYHVTEPKVLEVWDGDGKKDASDALSLCMEGRLIGGCLDCLATLAGTRLDRVTEFLEAYREDGFLWFLEACDLNPMGIRRALWQLKEAGWFRYVRGFLAGRPLCIGQEAFGMDAHTAVTGILREFHVPMILDMDLGHLPPTMPMISGALAKVSLIQETYGAEVQITYDMR